MHIQNKKLSGQTNIVEKLKNKMPCFIINIYCMDGFTQYKNV